MCRPVRAIWAGQRSNCGAGMSRHIDKYHLNLAAEYRVCSELLKRGIFATVTYGNMKGCNVVAVGPNRRAAVIEVKASQSDRFVTCLYQKYKTLEQPHPEFWVLCSILSRKEGFAERFFVLTHEELIVAQAEVNFPGEDFLTRSELSAPRLVLTT